MQLLKTRRRLASPSALKVLLQLWRNLFMIPIHSIWTRRWILALARAQASPQQLRVRERCRLLNLSLPYRRRISEQRARKGPEINVQLKTLLATLCEKIEDTTVTAAIRKKKKTLLNTLLLYLSIVPFLALSLNLLSKHLISNVFSWERKYLLEFLKINDRPTSFLSSFFFILFYFVFVNPCGTHSVGKVAH